MWINCQLLLFISYSVSLHVFVSTSLGGGGQLISCLYSKLIRSWICIVLHHGIHAEVLSSHSLLWNPFPPLILLQKAKLKKVMNQWQITDSNTGSLSEFQQQQDNVKINNKKISVTNSFCLKLSPEICVFLNQLKNSGRALLLYYTSSKLNFMLVKFHYRFFFFSFSFFCRDCLSVSHFKTYKLYGNNPCPNFSDQKKIVRYNWKVHNSYWLNLEMR